MNPPSPVKKSLFVPWPIIAVFVLMSLVIGILGFFFYDSQKRRITGESQANLAAIADLKVREVVNWLTTRREDGMSVQDNPFVVQGMEQLLRGKTSKEDETRLLIWMRAKQRTHHYRSLLLLDRKKNIRLCTDDKEQLGELAGRKFDEVMRSGKIIITDIHRDNIIGYVHLDMLVPIISPVGRARIASGVLLMRIDPHEFLYPLILSWPTPSPTAETLLVARAGKEIVYLNELRHRKNTALTLRLPVTAPKLPAARAAQGFEGVMEGLDYRNVPVLAAVRAIPGSSWHLVAKVDVEEVYARVRASFWRTALLVSMIIMLGGAIVGFIWRNRQAGLYKELYESKLEREALLKHYEYLTKYANDIILVMDGEGKLIEANERAVQAYGHEREILLQMNIRDVTDVATVADLHDLFKRLEERGGFIYEILNHRRDGTVFFGEVSARSLEIEGKRFYQNIIRDITERKEAEVALLKTENEVRSLNADLERRVSERTMQLEAANRELEAFSYSVSHDLRAPLRSMDGFSQALLEDYADILDETGKDYLMRVRSASQLMGELIDDLLRLSRITRAEMQNETVDLTQIVTAISRRLQESAPARQVEFVIPEGISAQGDAHLLAVALQNLYDNAWKFTGHNPRARIEFGTTTKEGERVYFVKDNGVGFDMEYGDKLFKVFQRLHSSKEFPGTGVGLATVKRIMQKHGGQVWAKGEVGRGATVYFSLT